MELTLKNKKMPKLDRVLVRLNGSSCALQHQFKTLEMERKKTLLVTALLMW